MNKNGPIIIIDDDQGFLKEILHKLDYPEEVIFFADGQSALGYLDHSFSLPYTFGYQYAQT